MIWSAIQSLTPIRAPIRDPVRDPVRNPARDPARDPIRSDPSFVDAAKNLWVYNIQLVC